MSFELSRMKIHQPVWPVRKSQKKGINKRIKRHKTLYFTHFPRSPQWMDLYQIWFRWSSRRCNQLCCILWQSVHGLWFCRGSKCAISHWLGLSPLTQCWGYRAACDKQWAKFNKNRGSETVHWHVWHRGSETVHCHVWHRGSETVHWHVWHRGSETVHCHVWHRGYETVHWHVWHRGSETVHWHVWLWRAPRQAAADDTSLNLML